MVGTQFVIEYIPDLVKALKGAATLEQFNAQVAKNMGSQYANATRIIGTSMDKISSKQITVGGKETIQSMQQLGVVAQMTDGSFKNIGATFTAVNGQVTAMSPTIKDVTGQFSKTSVETEKAAKNSLTYAENVRRLGERALLTIPIWFALRAAMTGITSTLTNGFNAIVEYDKVLQKLRKNLQGTPDEIQQNFKVAKKSIEEFSLATGKSDTEITKAIQRFATVGFDFATSMKAGMDATKLSIILFGDAEGTANAFARALRALVTDVNDTKKSSEEITGAFTLTSKLWETNAFEIGELSAGLEKFAGTAKTMNFTIEETLTLLAALSTRGLSADRAGTLLRTSTQKLEQNLSSVASVLGVKVNPAIDRTFDVFVKVTNAIAKLKNEAGTISPAVSEAIAKIFGGTRGGEPIRDIIADMANVNKAFQEFAKHKPNIESLDKSLVDVNKSLFRQVELFHNTNTEIGKAFVTGIIGGDNFTESLKNINESLSALQKNAEFIGTTFTRFAVSMIASPIGLFEFDQNEIKKQTANAISAIQYELNQGLQGKLNDVELNNLIIKLGTMDLSKFNISQQTIDALKRQTEVQIEKNLTDNPLDIKAKAKIAFQTTFSEQQDISKAIIETELARLKTVGATTSQILQTENALTKQFNIEEKTLDTVKRRLAVEQAIKEEKRLQNLVGADSMKLFDIANTNGVDVARKLGDVLAGTTDFSTFVRIGGDALDVFKKNFADMFKQQQAIEFFKGNQVPGMEGLQGGLGISIPEEAIRQRGTPTFDTGAAIARSRAISGFERISEIKATINAPTTINNNIDISKIDEVSDKVISKISEQLPQVGSSVNKALTEALEGKQSNAL